MKHKKKLMIAAVMAGMTLTLPALADGVSEAQLLASMCNTCHGSGGTGAKPNPSIDGEDPKDMVELLQAFASGEEPTTIMDRHAKGYSDEQLKLIADFYAE